MAKGKGKGPGWDAETKSPNPFRGDSPYPDEKPARNQGIDTWGENMYMQGGQSGVGHAMGPAPWPHGASRSDDDGDTWRGQRADIVKKMKRGSGGDYK